MSLGKRIALVLIGILLVSTIGAANATLTVDRTVMNPDFVSNTAEEEGVYAELADNVTRQVAEDLEGVRPSQTGQLPPAVEVSGFDTQAIADRAVTEEYVASQSRAALRSLYAYMEGETDTLNLVIDTRPVKENARAAIADEAATVDVAPLVELGAENIDAQVPINAESAGRLLDSQESYQAERQRFREQVRQRVREETGATGEELEQQVDRALQEINSEAKSQIDTAARQATQDYSENVTSAVIDLQYRLVDAYTTDQSYDAFVSGVERNQRLLGEEAARLASQEIDEQIDDRYRLSDLLDGSGQQELRNGADRGASVFGTVSTMSLVWPLVSLVLIGIAYVVSRSLHTTGRVTGAAMVVAALVGFLVATVLQGTVVSFLRDQIGSADTPIDVGDFVVGLVDGILGTLAAQSLVIGVFGVLLLALLYADRNGYLDGLKTKAGVGTASGTAGARPRGGQQQHQQGGQTQGGQPGQQHGGQPQSSQPNQRQGGQPGQQQSGQPQGGQPGHQQGGQPQGGQPNQQQGGQPQGHYQPDQDQGGQPQGGQPQDQDDGQPGDDSDDGSRSGSGSGQPNDR